MSVDWERLPRFKVTIKPAIVTLMELKGEKLEKMEAAAVAAQMSSLPRGGITRTSDYRNIAAAAETVLARSQGFLVSPRDRRAVERYAMDVATDLFAAEGYDVDDVSKCESCDLRCRRDSDEICVEVKGTQTAGEQVLLTGYEVEFARRMGRKMALVIVSGIEVNDEGLASGGDVLVIRPWSIDKGILSPYAYNYTVPLPRRR